MGKTPCRLCPRKKKKSWEISVTRFHVLKMLSSEKGKRGAARFDM